MKHQWTKPVWQSGRVHFAKDGNGDPAFWRMTTQDDQGFWENLSAEYDTREEMGR